MDRVLRWFVDELDEELASFELWDRGATAVAVEPGPPGRVALVASFPTGEAVGVVAAELGALVEEVPEGWRDAWKSFAEPVAIGGVGRLVVAPAWRPVRPAGSDLVVGIDPGPCFGSGSHASTRLLLSLLAARPPAGATVLDAGTGSGILAVVAARLGAACVTAVDVDPEAVAVVTANARRNGVADRVHASTTPVAGLTAQHDLALVNVTAAVHAEVGAVATRAVRPGGELWLAGLLPGQWRHVAAAYAGCDEVELPTLDGWAGAVLRRR